MISEPKIDLFEAISTLRSLRRYTSDPVSSSTITRIIHLATKAASGSNRQPWRFLIIQDPTLKAKIGDYYRRSFDKSFGDQIKNLGDLETGRQRMLRSANDLAHNMGMAPVLILACLEGEPGKSPTGITVGSSIYPAVQNLMLAARAYGLGTVITTLHKLYDTEIKSLLSIPDWVETMALIPMGYPIDKFGPNTRQPVESVTYRETWGIPFI